MTEKNSNPLSSYFRQPAIYISLPSGGKHYPVGSLEVTENGEYPVLPMTAVDEIVYRTPDALYNGQAVISVIESCMPNILNAWAMPACDIDAVLTAIRIASYGHEMEINTKCPKCSNENSYSIDLRIVLDGLKFSNYDEPVTVGDLQIFFKPMNFKNLNDNNSIQFEEQRLLQMLPDSQIDHKEKLTRLQEAVKKITNLTVSALSQSIAVIHTPTATVSEPAHIEEFLKNSNRKMFGVIRDAIIERKQTSELKPLPIECTECGHKYEQTYTLNMTDFFEDAS